MKVSCKCINLDVPCIKYYAEQAGNGGIVPFRGVRYQRGAGIFSSIKHFAIPLLKRGAVEIGKRLIKAGSKVFDDVSSGSSLKAAAANRFKEAGTELLSDIKERIRVQQSGNGRKRKQTRKQRKCQPTKRQRCGDIFD